MFSQASVSSRGWGNLGLMSFLGMGISGPRSLLRGRGWVCKGVATPTTDT